MKKHSWQKQAAVKPVGTAAHVAPRGEQSRQPGQGTGTHCSFFSSSVPSGQTTCQPDRTGERPSLGQYCLICFGPQ